MRAQLSVSEFRRHTHFLIREFTVEMSRGCWWSSEDCVIWHQSTLAITLSLHVTEAPDTRWGLSLPLVMTLVISWLSLNWTRVPSPHWAQAWPRLLLAETVRGKLPSVSKYTAGTQGSISSLTHITLPFTSLCCPLYFYCDLCVRCLLSPGADMHWWGFSGPVWCH